MPEVELRGSFVRLSSSKLLPITLMGLSLNGVSRMYNLEETSYGFKITATGTMDVTEAEQLKAELLQALCAHAQPFSLIGDIRGLIPPGPVVLEVIQEMQSVCRR